MSRSVQGFLTKLLVIGSVALVGCTKKDDSTGAAAGSGTAGETSAKPTKEVNLAIWSNYLSPELQERFTKETGIKINISNYSSNEELLAKVQSGASDIDVAVPSDYMVGIMVKTDLLQPLDSALIPNKAGVDPAVLKQEYDPENKFSLPFAWSTAGLAVNRDLYKGKITSWKDFFTNKELAGKISLLDDVREVTAAALKMHGYSVNSTNPKELEKAKATLKEVRSRVKMFRSDVTDLMVNQEVAIAHTYSPDPFLAQTRTKSKIEYIIPDEGGTLAIDNMVIFKGAKHSEEAHKLINFLLSEDVNVAFVTKNFGGPVLKSTKAKLPPELSSSPTLFPSPELRKKLERLHDVGDAGKLYDRLWTEIKAE